MHPAPSVILFTTLSGLGFGFLFFLGLGLGPFLPVRGWGALLLWGIGYGLAVAGLLASTFHLGQPRRALLAFTQWRSSWLSREAWAACATLFVLAPVALAQILGPGPGSGRLGPEAGWLRAFGGAGAVCALATVFTTSMIYTQLRSVPRWNHWLTPVGFLAFAVTGGAVLSGLGGWAAASCLGLGLVLLAMWRVGDGLFARAGESLATATGLKGRVRVLEPPHTNENYLMREMIHVVGRRHARRLRGIALALASVLPAVLCLLLPPPVAAVLAGGMHLVGALAARWLFFAQAEHVVGLYYGRR
ncbi:dimethyl sulfoxide reductase anchor subunit family protein [Pseudogemmobacter sonorensis]|uniref:dimethyl sulfoxide reductase anchor subunit family protein n=1 Tax=Pseudogemmobacter sonorensis TaxID=2989681 RepID=UPI003677D5A5